MAVKSVAFAALWIVGVVACYPAQAAGTETFLPETLLPKIIKALDATENCQKLDPLEAGVAEWVGSNSAQTVAITSYVANQIAEKQGGQSEAVCGCQIAAVLGAATAAPDQIGAIRDAFASVAATDPRMPQCLGDIDTALEAMLAALSPAAGDGLRTGTSGGGRPGPVIDFCHNVGGCGFVEPGGGDSSSPTKRGGRQRVS